MASRHEKALKASLSFLKGFMDHLYIILHCINSEVIRKVSQLYLTWLTQTSFIPVAPLEALNSSINFVYKTPPVIMNPTTANWAKKAKAQTSHCRPPSERTIFSLTVFREFFFFEQLPFVGISEPNKPHQHQRKLIHVYQSPLCRMASWQYFQHRKYNYTLYQKDGKTCQSYFDFYGSRRIRITCLR